MSDFKEQYKGQKICINCKHAIEHDDNFDNRDLDGNPTLVECTFHKTVRIRTEAACRQFVMGK